MRIDLLERRIDVLDIGLVFGGFVPLQVEHDFRHAAGLPIARALKDDIFHLATAQVLDALLAQNPGDRVGNVALAAAVRPDNCSYAVAGKAKVSMVRKGLESRDFETLKLEHRCPSFDAGGDGHQRVTFGRHYREMPPTCQQELEPLGFKLQTCARLVRRASVDTRRREENFDGYWPLALRCSMKFMPCLSPSGVVAS